MTEPVLTPAELPRWFRPTGGVRPPSQGCCTIPIGTELAGLARDRDLPLAELILTGYLAVLQAITSRQAPVTLVRDGGTDRCAGTRLPRGSWRELLEAVRTEPPAMPVDGTPESELDLRCLATGEPPGATALDPGRVLRLGAGWTANRLTLRLDYRGDLIEADYADRVAGYLAAAFRLLVSEPDSPVVPERLLGAAERAEQLHGHRGPDRPLPDGLLAGMFARQVRLRPDAIAATHRGEHWTYAELDRRAAGLAATLRGQGLQPEDVVAVVADRGLPWLAATLAVLRAGGVYLPVRPDFPAQRVATQLARSEARFALADRAGAGPLAAAQAADPGIELRTTLLDRLPDLADPPAADRVTGDRLAYIYFTSGSTGTPKGVMCEHAGMVNHLMMKVEDLGLTAADTVAQTASQCFDISLWQLLAPLAVGGRTLIVDLADQLDVGQFVALLAAGGIQVVQLVPSYLDVLIDHLRNRPTTLGDLRRVSVTGEALKFSLVQRWFELFPGIPLVNAYGATEVSDDTMHAVLAAPPVRGMVPVGTSLRNVGSYIVDEQLCLVPTGAPGEIVFSGVCVGRGYVNDPERTAEAFTTDPWRPGERLYRTGDYGRWLPEGTIEFLGRRDQQVKVRGYRIEIGEIENRLTLVPGVSDCAVVVAGDDDASRSLVGFYTGSPELRVADLAGFLAAGLPDYMVPPYLHRLPELPLTENGKIDKIALAGTARATVRAAAAFAAPSTASERRLAAAWAEVLGSPAGRIGLDDNFFALGGTSLSAVRLVVQLDRAVTLRQLTATPTIRQLAALIDEPAAPAAGRRALLQPLAGAEAPDGTLVCFPYAGGNAVNFHALAVELSRSGIAVLAAELPGHDVAVRDEPLLPAAEVGRIAFTELAEVRDPVLIWGHCAGAAAALELARLLAAAGRPAARVLLGSPPPVDPAGIRAERDRVAALTDRELTDSLRGSGGDVGFELIEDEREDLVGRAYRHDVRSCADYLLSGQPVLGTPVDLVIPRQPRTGDPAELVASWSRIAGELTVRRLACSGEHFVRTAASEVARLVRAVAPSGARTAAS